MLNDSDKFNGFILLNDEYKGVFSIIGIFLPYYIIMKE